ncbi:protoheme IX farnesyltransferase [Synechococcus sp. CBW1002]|jgi:protoheme IX farnesyltransferase|uniref:heme o synthase n=1 Tax=unclassified Synechococcus TaxID=2626047 RepID=UPI0018CEAC04|nr:MULTISPECIES: heme o synthase [unclassified Synechococcus]QPN58608.1 protoheme IX farnesyltransferase [Synechococcus sp. CBW1002]QPN65347.1 protoheme IX farnesyltransferase [Synechococcus sp. CBW1006]
MVSVNPEALAAVSRPAVPRSVRLPAWLEVAKPRLIPLLLATTLAGMALSVGWPLDPLRIICTLVGGALASAAAGVLNCLWEQELDGRMQRTSRRALPSGRLAQRQAFLLAILLTSASVAVLVLGVNPLAAALALLGLCSYVLLYTALLKPRTPRNIVVGGVAGAIPPLVGAAAAGGLPTWSSWWLFSLVMLWTPAHFWALALLLKDDYRSVGIPMLPVVKGEAVTALAIGRYAWATVLASGIGVLALPSGGLLYGLLVVPFNARLLQLSGALSRDPNDPQRARNLFRWSILYLFGICLLLVMARSPQAEAFSLVAFTPLLGLGLS